MIHVWIKRNQDGEMVEMTLDGHAKYAEQGLDIVCAAVSALSIGIVNSIEKFVGVALNPTDEGEEGFMWIQVPQHLSSEQKDKMHLLLNSLAFSLEGIAEQYPEYVNMMNEVI